MSDIGSNPIRNLLQNIVNAPTWEEMRQVVTLNQAQLLTDEADAEFASWIDEGSAVNDMLGKADLLCIEVCFSSVERRASMELSML